MEKLNELLERLNNVKSHSTDLNSQIEFFEILSEMFKAPITMGYQIRKQLITNVDI